MGQIQFQKAIAKGNQDFGLGGKIFAIAQVLRYSRKESSTLRKETITENIAYEFAPNFPRLYFKTIKNKGLKPFVLIVLNRLTLTAIAN
jgi:hypothetical protein